MSRRYLSIWFHHLSTDWFSNREPELRSLPFVLSSPSHGRMIISAMNPLASKLGLYVGMTIADAKALIPSLQVKEDLPTLKEKLLTRFAHWCIRFSPVVAIDQGDGLILEITGCAHLWGGEPSYLHEIMRKINDLGYQVRAAIAASRSAAWGLAHFAKQTACIEESAYTSDILYLPTEALQLDVAVTERLNKLGLREINDILTMPRASLKRRFGEVLTKRLNQFFAIENEYFNPIIPVEPYEERLQCMEPITGRKGIEIALQRLLDAHCKRLKQEQKGIRQLIFKGYREDGNTTEVSISTQSPSNHIDHLLKLFDTTLSNIAPGSGIEIFSLTATQVEDLPSPQEKIWEKPGSGLEDHQVSELYDRLLASKELISIDRFLPSEHHLPEKSYRPAHSLVEGSSQHWGSDSPRPICLLSPPELIEVTAPIPDYPPMFFIYQGQRHKIIKADGPERIEQEWWIHRGRHRDYYTVEDEEGHRYWLFRSGHYDEEKTYKWFIHGFFS